MTALHFVGDTLFPGAMVASVVAWGLALFFGIFEDLAIQQFVPWVFRLGPLVLRRLTPLRRPIWPAASSTPIGLQYGVAKVISPTECLFRQPFVKRLPSRFYSRGDEPRGIISWQDGQSAWVECRLSPRLVLFVGGWFIISTAAGGSIALAGRHLGGVVVLSVGWGISAVLYRSSVNAARLWAEEVLAELSNALPPDSGSESHPEANAYRPGR